MFTIEHDIPIPAKKGGRPKGKHSRGWSVLLNKMKIGDSVVLLTLSDCSGLARSSYTLNMNVTIRYLEDGTFRVWRIE